MAVKTVVYEATDGAEHAAAVMETAISASVGHRNVVSEPAGLSTCFCHVATWQMPLRAMPAHALRGSRWPRTTTTSSGWASTRQMAATEATGYR